MLNNQFKLVSPFKPAGDQPTAIDALVRGLKDGKRHQVLLGVTGSGKTFTAANVIATINKPTLVIAHNKTLAAQLAQEYKDLFPENAVHYFVSYYDFYQPEAYMPVSDTYIEKDAQINEEIERLRHASTQALLTRRDVIIVASVSCIYGLGSPGEYQKVNLKLQKSDAMERNELLRKLVSRHYERTNADLTPGTFRAIGASIEIMPPSERVIYNVRLSGGKIDAILHVDQITRAIVGEPESIFLFPAKHFITPEDERKRALKLIKLELEEQLKKFNKEGKLLEAERIKRRTTYDMAMIREVGYCNGIENYSRHLSGREDGAPPDTLLSYFSANRVGGPANSHGGHSNPDFLTIIDESHVTVSQIGGMYEGDQSRKRTLVEYGFRLPSALDNRPLRFSEFDERVGQILYTSATPGKYELEKARQESFPSTSSGHNASGIVEQIIRPTGLVDPMVTIRPILSKDSYQGQVKDLIAKIVETTKKGERSIATTLTKKMAEDLAAFLKEKGIKAEYLHSEIKTLERIKILTEFRKGTFDALVGVNLLREGLDLPEVSFIGILDADKEGFLRSETSLIQTIGRAARNVSGRVILYADVMTGSITKALDETNRRRERQLAFNKEHGITPKTIQKRIQDITEQMVTEHEKAVGELVRVDTALFEKDPQKLIKTKEKQMLIAAKNLDFETAALLRDEIKALQVRLKNI
jgi:excinuclease ABC subunit B